MTEGYQGSAMPQFPGLGQPVGDSVQTGPATGGPLSGPLTGPLAGPLGGSIAEPSTASLPAPPAAPAPVQQVDLPQASLLPPGQDPRQPLVQPGAPMTGQIPAVGGPLTGQNPTVNPLTGPLTPVTGPQTGAIPQQPVQAQPIQPVAEPLTGAIPQQPVPDAGPQQPGKAPGEHLADDGSGEQVRIRPRAQLTPDPELLAALHEVVRLGASDLHITLDSPPMLRIDGKLRPLEGAPIWRRQRIGEALLSILTLEQRNKFAETLELDLAFPLSEEARFRVNIYQQRDSMGAAFRIIPSRIKPLKELGMPEAIAKFASLPRGLVLVTGPTGSGKSTTLAGLIDLANETRPDHIMTVEDPIEFLHQHKKSLVNQREVGSDTHSFAEALKHVLRQDPDIILIGELRDLETIQVALTAAETGHLVFATLHTQDAPQTIDRVIDVFPAHQQQQVRSQLAAVLQGVVCQTLLPRASGQGRVVACEVMMMTPAIGNLIREDKTYQIHSAMQSGRSQGMLTMDAHLAQLVKEGIVNFEDAKAKAQDVAGFEQLVGLGR